MEDDQPLSEHARRAAGAYGAAADQGCPRLVSGTGSARRRWRGCRFDAVVCVFGVFFAPDMPAFAAEMWRLVRPGGVLAITTWGPGLFEPANTHFWESVAQVEPSLVRAFSPWDEITTPAALADLFPRAAVPAVVAVAGHHQLDRPDSFWDIVLGTGYRATIDALSHDQRDQMRDRLLGELRSRGITTVRTDVIFAAAKRPG